MPKPVDEKLDAPVNFYLTKEERRKLNKKAEHKYDSKRSLARYLRWLVIKDISSK